MSAMSLPSRGTARETKTDHPQITPITQISSEKNPAQRRSNKESV